MRHHRLALAFFLIAAVWLPGAALAQNAAPGGASAADPTRISATELTDLLETDAALVIDVRDEAMFARGHLPGARLAPPHLWREVGIELRTAGTLVVTYCSCPAEETSLRAAARFIELGVPRVRALTGGYEGWSAAGLPVAKAAFSPSSLTPAPSTPAPAQSSRESWQRIPDIFAAMGVAEGAVVADIGAGGGFFTTRFARAVGPTGRVYAVDVSQESVDRLSRQVKADGLDHVEVVLGAAHDPRLPEAVLDAALIINAYHEMGEHQAMLAGIRRALKPNGRLVIVEPIQDGQRGTPRVAQESRHQIAPHYVQQDALAAGFVIVHVEDPFTRRNGQMPEYLLALVPAPAPMNAAAEPPHVHTGPADDLARRPDDVVAALGLQPGQTIVDLGAGTGLFTRRFARAVGPTGQAVGLDIDASSVDRMRLDAATLGLANYTARVVTTDDAGLPPASADVVFLSNTYHHIGNRVPYFTRLREAIKPGGRLVIVDFPGGEMPDHPDAARVEAELGSAGYRLLRRHDFLRGQFFLEFVAK